jgi:hypothetical protein
MRFFGFISFERSKKRFHDFLGLSGRNVPADRTVNKKAGLLNGSEHIYYVI